MCFTLIGYIELHLLTHRGQHIRVLFALFYAYIVFVLEDVLDKECVHLPPWVSTKAA